MAIEKIKILEAVVELPAKQHCQSSPLTSKLGRIDQIGSAGSSKTAPRIFIFSIAVGAEYLSYVKSTFARVYYFDLSQFDGFPGPCSSLVLHGLPGSSGPLEPHEPP